MPTLVPGRSPSFVPRRVRAQPLDEAVAAAKLAAVMSEAVRPGLESLNSDGVPAAASRPLPGVLLLASELIP